MPTYYTHPQSHRIFLDKNELFDHPRALQLQNDLDVLCRWGRSDYDSANSLGWEFRPEKKDEAAKVLESYGFELAVDND